MQFVHLVERGERAQMSKRAGEFVTPRRADRARSASTRRAGSCSRARTTRRSTSTSTSRASRAPRTPSTTCSTRTRGSSRSSARPGERARAPPTATAELHPSERALIQKLLTFPDEVAEAADRRAPHRIAAYALELAQSFTAFYRDCHIVGSRRAAVPAGAQRRHADGAGARTRAPGRVRAGSRCERAGVCGGGRTSGSSRRRRDCLRARRPACDPDAPPLPRTTVRLCGDRPPARSSVCVARPLARPVHRATFGALVRLRLRLAGLAQRDVRFAWVCTFRTSVVGRIFPALRGISGPERDRAEPALFVQSGSLEYGCLTAA